MRKTRRIFIIAFLLCIFVYCCKIDSIPNSVILYGGEQLNLGNFIGISLKIGDKNCDTIFTSSDVELTTNSQKKETTVDVKLFNTFNVKQVSVSIIDKTTVIPVGQVSGLKLYTNGVLVVGMSEIKGTDNQKYKPYENCEIKVESAGYNAGNYSSVVINGKEYSKNQRGINIVVYDKTTDDVICSTVFDTWLNSDER